LTCPFRVVSKRHDPDNGYIWLEVLSCDRFTGLKLGFGAEITSADMSDKMNRAHFSPSTAFIATAEVARCVFQG
jgi:hypothetical protein